MNDKDVLFQLSHRNYKKKEFFAFSVPAVLQAIARKQSSLKLWNRLS